MAQKQILQQRNIVDILCVAVVQRRGDKLKEYNELFKGVPELDSIDDKEGT